MDELDIKLFPRQAECLEVLKRVMYVLFGGARGGGKTWLSRAYLVLRALRYPGTTHLVIRKSFPELERNHIMGFKQEYPWMAYNISRHTFTLPNGSTIECGFCQSDKDLQKWQGSSFATIVLDEAQFHDRTIFEFFKTILRTASTTGIVPRMLLTGNPGGYAWLKQTFIDRVVARGERPSDFAFVRSLVTDNPALMRADPDYVERLKSLPPALRAAFLEGDWNAIIGAFFELPPDMEEPAYQIDEGACRGNLFCAVDHGIRHSTASAMAYLDPQGHAHQLFMYTGTGFDAATHAAELVDRIKSNPYTMGVAPVKVWYDPSMRIESKLNVQMVSSPLMEYERVFREAGLGSVVWEAANNSRIFGAQIMQKYFTGNGVPAYRVWSEHNRDFRALMAQIMCDPNNAETYLKEETPADDVADMCRYLVVGLHGEAMNRKTRVETRMKMQQRKAMAKDWYSA